MKKKNGFSLLELLIVVAIILIIATLAMPTLLRSRQAANESHALANLRTLNTAEVSYMSNNQVFGDMNQLLAAGLLDFRYTSSSSGYNVSVQVAPGAQDYTATAQAIGVNMGRFDFYSKPDYVIRYSTDPTRAPTGLTGEPVR